MLVIERVRPRARPASPLLGHLPATAILDGRPATSRSEARRRAASCAPRTCPARPPGDVVGGWTVDPASGSRAPRARAPRSTATGTVTGTARLGARRAGRRPARRRRRDGSTASPSPCVVEATRRRERRGGHALRRDALARPRDARRRAGDRARRGGRADRSRAWYLAQALIAAESLGTRRDGARDVSVAVRQGALHVRPRDRLLPGRQAHASPRCCASSRTRARCCTTPAGRCDDGPHEFPLAASAARSVGRRARSTSPRAR